MADEVFLIDTNALITPHLTYYPFDFAPSFWSQMEENIKNGNIVILYMVKAEITQGNDALSDWMNNLDIGTLVDRRQSGIITKYSEVLTFLQNDPRYHEAALHEWSKGSVADPWLIATAADKGYTVITFEKPVGGLSSRNPSKRPKIPDVAAAFDVQTKDLFYLMRQLNFRL